MGGLRFPHTLCICNSCGVHMHFFELLKSKVADSMPVHPKYLLGMRVSCIVTTYSFHSAISNMQPHLTCPVVPKISFRASPSTSLNQDPVTFMWYICLVHLSGLNNKQSPPFPSISSPFKESGPVVCRVCCGLNLSVFMVVFDLFHNPPYLF